MGININKLIKMLSKLNTIAMLRMNMRVTSILSIEARDFGAKKKKMSKSDNEISE